MTRILHVLYSYLPVTQNWIYTQLRTNRHCDHHLISLTEENTGQFPWTQRVCAFPHGPVASTVGLLLARYWIAQPRTFLHAAISSARPDVVHGHFSTESWRVLDFVRAAGLPLVTTFYGLDVDKLSRRSAWKPRYRELFAYGSRFVVEGPFMAKRLEAIGCPKEKIRVVALGVDRERYRKIPRRTGDDSTVRILFVGLDREKKGPLDAVKVFCEAAHVNKNIELHIAGNGRYRRRVELALRTAGFRERAVFHGYVSFENYRELLTACDIVLVPSRHAADGDSEGGAPVVCIEAQAAGKPVVGTRHCDIPFVVRDGDSGMLSAEGDSVAMARDLLRLAADAEVRRCMGERGRSHVAVQHDSSLQAGVMADVYRSMLQGDSSGDGVHG